MNTWISSKIRFKQTNQKKNLDTIVDGTRLKLLHPDGEQLDLVTLVPEGYKFIAKENRRGRPIPFLTNYRLSLVSGKRSGIYYEKGT